MLKQFPIASKNPISELYTKHEKDYSFNVVITGSTDKAIFVTLCDLLRVHHSYYPVRFSIPNDNVVFYETDRYYTEQRLDIDEWAYQNCFMRPIRRILEKHGRYLRSMVKQPHFIDQGSPYKSLIKKIRHKLIEIAQGKNENKKIDIKNIETVRKKNNTKTHDNNDKRVHKNIPRKETKTMVQNIITESPTSDRTNGSDKKIKDNDDKNMAKNAEEEAEVKLRFDAVVGSKPLYIFHTDGAGNLQNDVKTSDNGHFSVFLKNTKEKWKKRMEKLTSNQAELLGIISAMHIAIDRKYDNVFIFTDSQNSIKWYLGRDKTLSTNIKKTSNNIWSTKDEKISKLVDKMVDFSKKIDNLSILWIERSKNLAHAI